MHFRLFHIPIYIHPSFLLLLFIFTLGASHLTQKLIMGSVITLSLLVHEYGHALTARYFGAHPIITLHGLGGQAVYDGSRMTWKQKFLIVLNGPLFESSLILLSHILIKMGIFEHIYSIQLFLYWTRFINIVWCLFNLLPILPLDGGRLVQYLLEKKFGDAGYRAILIISLVCTALVIPYFIYQRSFLWSSVLFFSGLNNFRMLKQARETSSGFYNPFNYYLKGVEAIKENDLEKGKAILKKLLRSKDIKIKHAATESLATIYTKEKKEDKSYQLLLNTDHDLLKEGKCLLCRLAFERKNYDLVGKYARDIYEINPSYDIALLNSQTFGYLNKPALAGAWLETASQFGDDYLKDLDATILNSSYDSVRGEADFKDYIEKIRNQPTSHHLS